MLLLPDGEPCLRLAKHDLKIVQANDAALRLFGKDLIGRNFRNLPFDKSFPRNMRNYSIFLAEISKNQVISAEFTIPSPKGGALAPFINATVLSGTAIPEEKSYMVVIHDITAEKNMGHHDRKYPAVFNQGYTSFLIERLIKSKTPFWLAMGDINDFKSFNSQYGHGTGDVVIGNFAKSLALELQAHNDVPARFGGDELGSIELSEPDPRELDLRFNRINQRLARKKVYCKEVLVNPASISYGVRAVTEFPSDVTVQSVLDHSSMQFQDCKKRRRFLRARGLLNPARLETPVIELSKHNAQTILREIRSACPNK